MGFMEDERWMVRGDSRFGKVFWGGDDASRSEEAGGGLATRTLPPPRRANII